MKAQLDITALESESVVTAASCVGQDNLAQFQPRLQRVVNEVEQADLRKFRTLSQERQWQQLVARATLPLALRLTREARALVAEVMDVCEQLRCAAHSSKSSPTLLALVRRVLPHKDVLPEGRSLLLARDGAHFRLWMVTPPIASLDRAAQRANAEGAAALLALFARSVAGFEQLGLLGLLDNAWPGGSAGLALQDARVVLLSLDEGEQEPGITRSHPLCELHRLLAQTDIARDKLTFWTSLEKKFMSPKVPCENEEAS